MANKRPVIVYDQDIPDLADELSALCELHPYQAGALSAEQLQTADGLIVRSVTPVNAALLVNTACRWVGSVTAGVNHLDTKFLAQAGIAWDHAPGANAPAVCEYVLSALFLAVQAGVLEAGARLAVIGVGEVGSRVVAACEAQGFTVLSYDPPRAKRDTSFVSSSWEDLASCELAIVCTSYTQTGEFPSHQLIRAQALQHWRGIINAARGEIIDYAELFAQQPPLWTALDVWPNEPDIDPRWVQQATIATPHIAGYSAHAKWRLSAMIVRACCDFFALPQPKLSFAGRESAWQWADTVGLPELTVEMKEADWTGSPDQSSLCPARSGIGGRRGKSAGGSRKPNSSVFHQLRRDYPLR